ncbi:nitroreductase [Maritimibacter sp. 55A14]|uniref:nitroreductase family protein n=1 Tax=Maritimibacter sp. 55A14 TaxID=2174844 RepID=UPI000D60ECB4|nr:nitroreductase family protein [Maritimibacter sp. 55A14]PWE33406.1 nitroreductase [Maritimibacter sp. 55A14]
MPEPRPEVLDFLLTRRSHPARTLGLPVPDRAALAPILRAAARSPDHGKLEPWRFIVLERAALTRLAALAERRGRARGEEPEKLAKLRAQFAEAHLAVAVVASAKPSGKIPELEQTLSAGAVCLAALNAALAAGWGANWLTGWPATDRDFLTEGLALAGHEFVAGFIHIGTRTATPPDRPRPDIESITQWVSE